MAYDFKKECKDLYAPKTTPTIIDVPVMAFIMIDGKGDPNSSEAFQNAVEMLYGLSYAIKMSKKGDKQLEGYFDYVVPPLEGLWNGTAGDKSGFVWTSMIRQPDFVTENVFEQAKDTLSKKKPSLDLGLARLERFVEGLCVQVMHLGSYNDEPSTVAVLDKFAADSGYSLDFSAKRRHHEIYLGDPRKTAPGRLKTAIRHPIKSIGERI